MNTVCRGETVPDRSDRYEFLNSPAAVVAKTASTGREFSEP